MPVYTYRREDGTTFDFRQKFTDEPLISDPTTGQRVTRVVQAAGVIFKGSGFYVTDTKGAGKSAAPTNGTSTGTDTETKTEATKTETPKTEAVKTEAAAD